MSVDDRKKFVRRTCALLGGALGNTSTEAAGGPVSGGAPTDPGAVLGALVDILADAVAVRLRAAGLSPASTAEAPSTWYTQDSAPIARRTYLDLCRRGEVESRRVGKVVLVRSEILDAWIAARGPTPSTLAPVAPVPAAPTDEELMRGAGFRGIGSTRVETKGRGRRTARPAR